jgi:hypothetical protein
MVDDQPGVILKEALQQGRIADDRVSLCCVSLRMA